MNSSLSCSAPGITSSILVNGYINREFSKNVTLFLIIRNFAAKKEVQEKFDVLKPDTEFFSFSLPGCTGSGPACRLRTIIYKPVSQVKEKKTKEVLPGSKKYFT